jgi:hypothetical protein
MGHKFLIFPSSNIFMYMGEEASQWHTVITGLIKEDEQEILAHREQNANIHNRGHSKQRLCSCHSAH